MPFHYAGIAKEFPTAPRDSFLVANADCLFAVHGNGLMGYRAFHGQRDLERLFGDGGLGRMRIPDYASSRVTLVASDFEDSVLPPEWTQVPERAIVTFSRSDDPVIETF